MPYIAVKAYPKDEKIKKEVAERIAAAFTDLWGCPREAVSVSFEEVAPQDWTEKVVKPEIESNRDKFFILDGKAVK